MIARAAVAVLIGVFTLACSATTADEPVVFTTAPSAVVATDPRVGELQVLVTELLDRIEVLTARIERMETQPPAPQAQVTRSQPAPAQPTPAEPRATTRPANTSPVAATPRPASSGEIGETYRRALELYGRGQTDNARAAFQAVLDADPGGDLADNALYWIGEIYFASGRYPEAISHFQRVDRDYSGENKAPDALLKMGMAHAKSGDLVQARQTFETLIQRYPYSTAAAAAKVEIRRIAY